MVSVPQPGPLRELKNPFALAQVRVDSGVVAPAVHSHPDRASDLIEQVNELVRRLNRQIGRAVLFEAKALIPHMSRLPGSDGKAKMSKSQRNAVPLPASDDEIAAAVQHMYTDPHHLRASDP
ncbi:hypothetical protein [Novosphingobium album (ex Liu et al. 2023)]|uniref:Tryptophan--tRNA ligase n=1 Tax=Novosphingobium album (ex Liu et al. 2023) TaxID=3031130 RepID=A0ABT5WWJ4_9SPHN|nr:hypothetical protein [Novosphingobium album (ex Liu et al. 2023)]MDE8654273.1 hypothetical protein [Novosphingobium album (ex Liu et al. 2023)]